MISPARLWHAGAAAVWIAVALLVGVRAGIAGRGYLKARAASASSPSAGAEESHAYRLVQSLRTLHERSATEQALAARDPFTYKVVRQTAAAAPVAARAPEPQVRVIMTVVEADQSWAKLQDGDRSVRVSVGDTFQGKRVVQIDSGGVVLRGAGGDVRLRFR